MHVEETETIKADIDISGKLYAYWQRVCGAVWSDPAMLEMWDADGEKVPSYIEEKRVEAKEKFAESYRAWMKPSKIE